MFNKPKFIQTSIEFNESEVSETIEEKVSRMKNNNEPIKEELKMIYTSSETGVLPETDIRTDKWELAQEQMAKVTQMKFENRKAFKKAQEVQNKNTSDNSNSSQNKQS